ncbi:MAG TPA: M56 family metallopeptidase [Pseudacidobacterium sp.]|jgi:TonB family protein|nr:M56 family metallopeptidase [Pseudacidobacterium sp.]
MTTFKFWILTYLLNSLWQVPLVFIAAWAATRLARQAGPRMEHRVWVIALLLEVTLPFCHFQLNELREQAWASILSLLGTGASVGETHVILGTAATSIAHPLRLPAEVITAIVAAYLCSFVYFTGRLLWALWKTESMRRNAMPAALTEETREKFARCGDLFNIDSNNVHVAVSPMIAGPVTVGIRPSTLVLPPEFLENVNAEDLDTVFAHEFAHLRRWDFAKNLFCGFVALPVAWHPLLWLTRSRLAETREIVCDAMAAEAVSGREGYACSLLRLASMQSNRAAAGTLHAIGIFDANVFERRIMKLTRKNIEVRGLQRFAIAAICGVIALATCASALAFRMDAGTSTTSQSKQPNKVHVSPDVMQQNLIYKVQPVYPPDAKKAKVQGSVVLTAVIGKDGAPEQLHVESGDPMLQQSALDAVKEWRWKPYLLNGNPVEVETRITVVYSLAK